MSARQSRRSPLTWRKSSHSSGQQGCIEIAYARPSVLVRDSHNRSGAVLAFKSAQWSAFLGRVHGHRAGGHGE